MTWAQPAADLEPIHVMDPNDTKNKREHRISTSSSKGQWRQTTLLFSTEQIGAWGGTIPRDKSDNESIGRIQRAITVTRNGRPVLAVLPYELYESIMETLDIMGDAQLMDDLRKSIREIETGSTVSIDALDSALGL